MSQILNLNDLRPGEAAAVERLLCTGGIRRRLLDLGLVENTLVKCVGESPHGDPKAYLIRGAVIAIRSEDSTQILIGRRENSYGSDC